MHAGFNTFCAANAYVVTCAAVTQKVRIRPPRPQVELISRAFNAHQPSISDGERHATLTCMPCTCKISEFEPTPVCFRTHNPLETARTICVNKVTEVLESASVFSAHCIWEPPSAPMLTCEPLTCVRAIMVTHLETA
jgi:hypothetical protein